MKFVYTTLALMLVVHCFLLFRFFKLELEVKEFSHQQTNLKSNDNPKQVNAPPIYTSIQTISSAEKEIFYEQIRHVVRDEVLSAIAQVIAHERPVSPQKSSAHNAKENDELVSNLEIQVDEYLTDGLLSEVELSNVEHDLRYLNFEDRQKVLRKMARAMNEANAKLSN